MRCALIVAVLLVVPGGVLAGGLGLSIPPGVPDAAAMGWERISGNVATETEGAEYEFYVNPRRQAIYEVVRYRFTRNGRSESEKVVWNRHPTGGQGPACFSHEPNGGWRTLKHGSDAYRIELATAMRVYDMHRQARLGE